MALNANFNNAFLFTATINKWINVLENDIYKLIIINSLKFLVNEKRVLIYGFVIMPNHMHIIWMPEETIPRNKFQGSLLRFTAQQIKFDLLRHKSEILDKLYVNSKDRQFQIWKRNPLSKEIRTDSEMERALSYIHENPLQPKWQLVESSIDYKFSSAAFYESGVDNFGFLTSYLE